MKHLPNGMYQQGDSVIHRLDSTIKILLLIIILAAVIATDTLIGYVVLIAFTLCVAAISGIGFYASMGNVFRMSWFFVIIFLMNLCFFKTDNEWIKFWIFTPSYDGLMQGIKVVVRVFAFLVMCNVLNASTPPVEVTAAIENVISPLRFVKIPTQQIALIISVAIQFIPTLSEEADMIRKAQIARGAKFDSPKLLDKASAVLPMIVPIFISAFRRADELSLAMEARGYQVNSKHQKRKSVHIGTIELAAISLSAALLVLQITLF